MTDSLGKLRQPGFALTSFPYPTGGRRLLALLLVTGVTVALAELARSATSTAALAACLVAAVALLVSAVMLGQARIGAPTDRLAPAADSLALFLAAMIAPVLLLDDGTRSEVAVALLALVSAGALLVSRVLSGPMAVRLDALTFASAAMSGACLAVGLLDGAGWLTERSPVAGPLLVATLAPLVIAGFSWGRPAPAALSLVAGLAILLALTVERDWSLGLATLGAVAVGGIAISRPRLDGPEPTLVEKRPHPWAPAAALVAIAATAVALDGSWRWLAIGSFAVLAACTIAAQGADIIARERLLVRLTRLNQLTASQARLDPLTRLPNRAALDTRLAEEVERAIRYRHPVAILFIDVDRFKAINDLFGHAAGDSALREISARIRATIRTPDFVARFGGEEFVVIAPGTWSVDAVVLGSRIQTAIGETVHHQPGEPVTVSIGIAGVPEHAIAGDDVLRASDEALYRAKHNGGNRIEIAAGADAQDRRDSS